MNLILNGKGLVLGGLTFKNRGHWGSRYIISFSHDPSPSWIHFVRVPTNPSTAFPAREGPFFRQQTMVVKGSCFWVNIL